MWNDLSMADKAKYIKLAVNNGITSLSVIRDTYNEYKDGGYLSRFFNWLGLGDDDNDSPKSLTRVRDNDSPTGKYSTYLEDDRAKLQERLMKYAESKGHSSKDYYIPYIMEDEIKVPGVGRVSSNVLDSIAVNAERAGITFEEGLGLASIETKLGASPLMSVKGYKKGYVEKHKRNPSQKEVSDFERAALNASFMRNYGGINPQFLVNDHEWSNRGWEESPKYSNTLQDIESPLEHAFTLYRLGLYNPGDKSHTSKVKNEGARLSRTKVIRDWRNKNKKSKK